MSDARDDEWGHLGLEVDGVSVAVVTTGDVIYRGRSTGDVRSSYVIEIYGRTGEMLGVVGHVVKHSPTGMSWGYVGSGPSDAARSLLIAVLGDDANCPECGGTRFVLLDATDPSVYEPTPPIVGVDAADRVIPCPGPGCEKGIRPLPYHAFQERIVAGLPNNWVLTRADILEWLRRQRNFNVIPARVGRY